MDLEKQIEDDLIDLKIEMDTNNFGTAALDADAKKASRVTGSSKKSSAK